MDEIMILLPDRLYILRDLENQDLAIDKEQYTIYYKHLLYPYKEDYDIQIECEYGANFGKFWRIENFPENVSEFDLKVVVYGFYGKKLAEKSTKVKIVKKSGGRGKKLLCIGDSMTQQSYYVEYVARKIPHIKTLGTRRLGSVNHEGRGGWQCQTYFERIEDTGNAGVSPFMFPKNIAGKDYYGSKIFYDSLTKENEGMYRYMGFTKEDPLPGMYYIENGIIGNFSTDEKIENPEFEFSFSKYLERHKMETPDMVSILFGANEFQRCPYSQAEEAIEIYLSYMDKMITSVKEASKNIDVIVNLPVVGAEQYAWGIRLGCTSSAKQYEYVLKCACHKLLEKYDNRQSEGIYISPMLLSCSPESGFKKLASPESLHSDLLTCHDFNWVHPSPTGYMQMGTVLTGVVEEICQR